MTEKLSTDVQLILENVPVTFLFVEKPLVNKEDPNKKTYTCHPLLVAGSPEIEKVRAAQRSVAKAAWGEKMVTVSGPVDASGNPGPDVTLPAFQAILNELAQKDFLCLHSGNRSKPGKDEYKDKFYVSANNKKQPNVFAQVNGQNALIPPGHPSYPYSGCVADVMISIYAQKDEGKSASWGKRINAQFMGIKFRAHGTPFGGGGRVARADEFGVVAQDADSAPPAAAVAGSDLV
jgi:hypothetical protein